MDTITLTPVSRLLQSALGPQGHPLDEALDDYPHTSPAASRNMLAVVARHGIRTPIAINAAGHLTCDGVGQLWAARTLGLDEVPILRT